MDLNYVVDGIKDKLTEVEHNRLRNEKDIHVYFKNQRGTYTDLQNFKGNTEVQLKDMAAAVVASKDFEHKKRQEMIAKIEESRAEVVAAEASVPKAIADSLLSGRLSIMDYYKLRNITADTEMRQSIAGTSTTGPSNPTRSN
jgi:uncharacterized protein YqfA (UPF0365 family)